MPHVRHSNRSLKRCVRTTAPASSTSTANAEPFAFVEGRLDRIDQTRAHLGADLEPIDDDRKRGRRRAAGRAPAAALPRAPACGRHQQAAEAAAPERSSVSASGSRRVEPASASAAVPSRRSSVAASSTSAVSASPSAPSLSARRLELARSGSRSRRAAACRRAAPAAHRPRHRATRARPACRTAGRYVLPDPRPEQPQVVVNLGGGADRRARIANAVLLANRDGRGDAVDRVDIRLLHPLEELPGVGGQRFDVAALSLGVDGVEGERRLARPAHAREDHERAGAGCVRSTPFRLWVRAPRTTSARAGAPDSPVL